MEVGALAKNLSHKCIALEEEDSKVSRVTEIEKEKALRKEDLVEECHLKKGVISKAQHVVAKVFQFYSRLT